MGDPLFEEPGVQGWVGAQKTGGRCNGEAVQTGRRGSELRVWPFNSATGVGLFAAFCLSPGPGRR